VRTTIASWGHKAVVLMLQVARRMKKMNHLSIPRELDINPELPLWGKLLLLHHFALGVPTSGTLKNRGVLLRTFFWSHCQGRRRRSFTFVSFSFTLDFAIVFLFSSYFSLLFLKKKNQKKN
jgi:hypothetical protein